MPGLGSYEFRSMVSRLVAIREPNRPGFEEKLTANAARAPILLRRELHEFRKHLARHIEVELPESTYPRWVIEPNPKKDLRVSTDKIKQSSGTDKIDDTKKVDYKPKRGEIVGENKARAIADLGAWRTQATAHVIEQVKKAWAVPFETDHLLARYVKSSTKDELRTAFRELCEPKPGVLTFVYHSDDSCVGALCSDGYVRFNGDIKKCDGSHRQRLFDTLQRMLTHLFGDDYASTVFSEEIDRAFLYLRSKLRVRNCWNWKEYVIYDFIDSRLYSGSVLTTIINNYANLWIALAMSQLVGNPLERKCAEIKDLYILAGEQVGYQLKVQDAEEVEKLQFLKHSPYMVESGVYEPWMNFGTYLRGFGTYKGDLPLLKGRKGTIPERAAAFVSDVVVGRRTWGQHSFADSFEHLVVCPDSLAGGDAYRVAMEEIKFKSSGSCLYRIPDEVICRRYDIPLADYQAFIDRTTTMKIFEYVDSGIAQRMYDRDYG